VLAGDHIGGLVRLHVALAALGGLAARAPLLLGGFRDRVRILGLALLRHLLRRVGLECLRFLDLRLGLGLRGRRGRLLGLVRRTLLGSVGLLGFLDQVCTSRGSGF
jgi:hypothetical protein